MMAVSFAVNARSVGVTAYGGMPLPDVLHNGLGHTSTR